ncbi:MAG: hypothetical protein KC609_09160 [Myxococcales bacterium]|nr:hypothetical protein [Myxococcales bacterium]
MTNYSRAARLLCCLACFAVLHSASVAFADSDPRDHPDLPRDGRNCLGKPYNKLYLTQVLAGLANPSALIHILELSYCMPLFRFGGPLFDLSNIEVGAVNYLSPSFSHYGAFFSIAPASFFVLRAEVTFFHQFSFPIDGKGYYPLTSYDDDFRDETLKKDKGKSASGVNARLRATLRLKFPITSKLAVALVDNLYVDYWWVDRNSYYKNLRWDLVMQRSDVVIVNDVNLLLEIAFHPNMTIYLGAYNETAHVPRDPYTSNIAAGVFMYQFKRLGKVVRNLTLIARGGAFTNHANRKNEYYLMAGIALQYDLKTWWK